MVDEVKAPREIFVVFTCEPVPAGVDVTATEDFAHVRRRILDRDDPYGAPHTVQRYRIVEESE